MKNKIFPIVCIFLLIILCFLTTVKADSTKTVSYGGNTFILPDECTDNFFIIEGARNILYLICGNYPDWKFSENNGDVVVNNVYNGTVQTFYWYSLPKGQTDFRSYTSKTSGTWATVSPVKNCSYEGVKVLYSSNNLYRANGELFFQVTPLAQIVAVEKPETVTKEILGVLPLIIVVVVSFLGLRKALRMLSNFFKRS